MRRSFAGAGMPARTAPIPTCLATASGQKRTWAPTREIGRPLPYLDRAEADPLGELFRALLPFAIAIDEVGRDIPGQ